MTKRDQVAVQEGPWVDDDGRKCLGIWADEGGQLLILRHEGWGNVTFHAVGPAGAEPRITTISSFRTKRIEAFLEEVALDAKDAIREAKVIRPAARPTEKPYGTCDWGGCDNEVIDWRISPTHGWLPVCFVHAESKTVVVSFCEYCDGKHEHNINVPHPGDKAFEPHDFEGPSYAGRCVKCGNLRELHPLPIKEHE